MVKVSLLLTEHKVNIKQLCRHLSVINTEGIQVELVFITLDKLTNDELVLLKEQTQFKIKQLQYPEDENLLFRDVINFVSGEFIIILNSNQIYPSDFLLNIFEEESKKDKQSEIQRLRYKERLLKAVQQSKYGLGIVKQDIKRAYPEFKTTLAYNLSSFTKLNILELEVNEGFQTDLQQLAQRMNINMKEYSPNYKNIQYYSNILSYKKAVKENAPDLSFRNKSNAVGLPLYMMLFILLCLMLAPFMITAVFPLLVMGALYLLAITLESLAIVTIKKQGDLFLGLMFFFPALHAYYLWSYFGQLTKRK